ncbi:MAG: DUF349 domain-containing protein [Janthinobacterium lividum]
MFLSFFKRSARPAATPEVNLASPAADERPAGLQQRQAAGLKAAALANNEQGAADFILECEFAEARLIAAQFIHSATLLEKVALAMRNTDRRVARLMQQRLEAMQKEQARAERALACLDNARRLSREPLLMVNQVADLDRAWREAAPHADATSTAFELERATLRRRLEAQAALQRKVIDLSTRLRDIAEEVAQAQATQVRQELGVLLGAMDRDMAACRAEVEAPSLPKLLLAEFDRRQSALAGLLAAIEQRQSALAAHEAAFAEWETVAPAELNDETVARNWRALPALHEEDLPRFCTRLELLLDAVRAARKPVETAQRVARHAAKTVARGPQNNSKFDAAAHDTVSALLAALETALADGTLQAAAEQDRALRSMDLKAYRLSAVQTARLMRARAELGNLQAWAKWGGNVSREELLKAAEDLPGQGIAVLELAKKVGSLRERWKSLDASAGPAARELWLRFDAACGNAYAPAAEHFKKLADERAQHLLQAQELVEQVRHYAAATVIGVDAAEVDWKSVAGFCSRISQAWQRLGSVDRKERKRRDAEFTAALLVLSEPLALRQQAEIERREALIAEVGSLNATDRRALDTLQGLQERWQEQARALPLGRVDEQALWAQFRSACDAVFARRREAGKGADAERRANQDAKLELCEALEAVIAANAASEADPAGHPPAPAENLRKLLRATQQAWNGIGALPRASEREVEARYRQAVETVEGLVEDHRRAQAALQCEALRSKLALCRVVEQALHQVPDSDCATLDIEALSAQWQAAPVLAADYERALRSRFERAVAAMDDRDHHATLLRQNQPVLLREVLRLEIMVGHASPPELSQERLQLQVEVLKSSLAAGQKPVTRDSQLLHLCAMPAVADDVTVARMERLIQAGSGY